MTNRLAVLLIAVPSLAITLPSGCNEGTFRNHYSTAQEIDLGRREDDRIEHTEKMDNDPTLNTRVQIVAAPIFKQAELMRSDVTYKVEIIDSPEVNAFSIPGGWIYLYSGLLKQVGPDNDALACIIGHETAHVVRRHVVEQLSDEEVKGTLVSLIGLATNNYNVYNSADTLFQLDQLHYSRQDEYEADKYGLMFAYNAGYDPYGMIRFFTKLEKLDKGDQSPIYMEDHPLTRNRIDRAYALINELRDNSGRYPDNVDKATAAAANAAAKAPPQDVPGPEPAPPPPASAAPASQPPANATNAPQ